MWRLKEQKEDYMWNYFNMKLPLILAKPLEIIFSI